MYRHQYLFLHRTSFSEAEHIVVGIATIFYEINGDRLRQKISLSFRKMREAPLGGIVVVLFIKARSLGCGSSNGSYLHGYLLNSGFSEEIRSWHSVILRFRCISFGIRKISERGENRRLPFFPSVDDTLFLVICRGRRLMLRPPGSNPYVRRCI